MTDIVDHKAQAWAWICLRYRSDHNIKKWVEINPEIGNEFEAFFDKINNFLDPDQQSGVMLEWLGKFVGLYPRPSYTSGGNKIVVNDQLYRMLIKGKIFKNSGRATIVNVCDAVEYVTGAEIKELEDNQDMTYQLVFLGDISDDAKIVLDNFDIFPRPQGVKSLGYRVELETGFGYDGPYGSKFRQYDEGAYNT